MPAHTRRRWFTGAFVLVLSAHQRARAAHSQRFSWRKWSPYLTRPGGTATTTRATRARCNAAVPEVGVAIRPGTTSWAAGLAAGRERRNSIGATIAERTEGQYPYSAALGDRMLERCGMWSAKDSKQSRSSSSSPSSSSSSPPLPRRYLRSCRTGVTADAAHPDSTKSLTAPLPARERAGTCREANTAGTAITLAGLAVWRHTFLGSGTSSPNTQSSGDDTDNRGAGAGAGNGADADASAVGAGAEANDAGTDTAAGRAARARAEFHAARELVAAGVSAAAPRRVQTPRCGAVAGAPCRAARMPAV